MFTMLSSILPLTVFHLAVSSTLALTANECVVQWDQVKMVCNVNSGTCPDNCLTLLEENAAECPVDWGRYIFGYNKVRGGACDDVYMDWYMAQRGTDCDSNLDADSIKSNFCIGGCSDRCQELTDGLCDYCDTSDQTIAYKIELGCGMESCDGTGGGTTPTAPAPSPTVSSPTDPAPSPTVPSPTGQAPSPNDSAPSDMDSGSPGLKSHVFLPLVAAFAVLNLW